MSNKLCKAKNVARVDALFERFKDCRDEHAGRDIAAHFIGALGAIAEGNTTVKVASVINALERAIVHAEEGAKRREERAA